MRGDGTTAFVICSRRSRTAVLESSPRFASPLCLLLRLSSSQADSVSLLLTYNFYCSMLLLVSDPGPAPPPSLLFSAPPTHTQKHKRGIQCPP